MFTLINYY